MKSRIICLCVGALYGGCLTLTPEAAFGANPPAVEEMVNAIATNAFIVLRDIRSVGLEQSITGIETIIKDHRRLSRDADASLRHFSLVLADAVAYAIISEIRAAELLRDGDTNATNSASLDKNKVIRLWKANTPDFSHLIKASLQGEDMLVKYASQHSSVEDVLSGGMTKNASVGQISSRLTELNQMAELPGYVRRNPSPDEQLVYALNKYQAFRDLSVIVDLYGRGELPNDSESIRGAIDSVLVQYPKNRVDDGMKSTSFKIWLTYRHYYPEASSKDAFGPQEEYVLRQSFVLAPFMSDTSALPENARKGIAKLARMGSTPLLLEPELESDSKD
jgi:hypothetical protein